MNAPAAASVFQRTPSAYAHRSTTAAADDPRCSRLRAWGRTALISAQATNDQQLICNNRQSDTKLNKKKVSFFFLLLLNFVHFLLCISSIFSFLFFLFAFFIVLSSFQGSRIKDIFIEDFVQVT